MRMVYKYTESAEYVKKFISEKASSYKMSEMYFLLRKH